MTVLLALLSSAAVAQEPADVWRLSVTGEVFAGYEAEFFDGQTANAFTLDRAALGLGFDWRALVSEIGLDVVRSAEGQSQLGVDGNALLLRARRAWLGGDAELGVVRLRGAFGIVGDPWLEVGEEAYDLRGAGPLLTERADFLAPGDLGVRLNVSVWQQRLWVELAVLNGEGFSEIELNETKDLLAVVGTDAWQSELFGHPAYLRLAVAYRSGSVGAGDAANSRVHALLAFASARARLGAEYVHAFGYLGQGDRDASGLTLYLSGEPALGWLGLLARYDRVDADLSADDAVSHRIEAGVYSDFATGSGLPGHARLILLYGHDSFGAGAGEIGGVPEANAVDRVELRLDFRATATY